jgi:hypothetical protein
MTILTTAIVVFVDFKLNNMNWTITFRSNYGNRWTVETITVTADTRTEAIRKADKWPGIIIKVERDVR